ncbi:MAG TPA: adenylate/guanylate cyclase domain-containing protein [Candidatus Dormibacteraeota bacterium]
MVRKTVTILFADVTGSTAMGEQSDPEALRRVMTRFFEVSRATLERHGATVEKFIGDAVMAVFGVPAVHEDDALRAARAALELRRNVAALGIELRIGINTGEVVAEEGETLITGDAVNVAARLEQGASAGEILLGDATYRFARDALSAVTVAPLNAKGKSQPVVAWRLLDVLDDAPAFTRRIDAPFVGRGDELARLTAAFEMVVRTNAARRFTLLGAPGIGKSRLARELVQHVSGQARVVVGRCQAYGEGITYLPLAEMVRMTAGAQRDGIAAVAGDDLVADRIAAAIGVGGVAGTKEETQWAARRYLEVLATDRPLLVVLDDLHWAEPTFLDLVEYVADFATAPMLLLCTGRAELLDARPGWTGPRPNAEVLALEPLSAEEAAQLAGDVDDETRRRILDTAEGNPLFVEQLVALQAQADGDIGIPPTLHALLAARLDSLAPAERIVLERAAVEGRLFHRGSVTELVPADVRPNVGAVLLALVRKEFVRPDRAQFPGDDGYRFTHVLLRDAAYEAMSKQLRAELHEKLFDWLQRVATERIGEMEEILAYHLERSALYRNELDLPDENHAGQRAAELLASSGTRAYDRGDVSAAQGLLNRAVALLPPGDPTRVRVLPLLAAAILDAATGMERALGLVAQAVEESRAANDRAAELSAWAIHQLVSLQTVPDTDTVRIRRELETRGPEIERLRDGRALVYLRRLELAIALTEMVDLDSAAERLLAAARDAGDRPSALQAMLFLTASSALGSIPVDEALLTTQRWFRTLAQGPVEDAAVDDIEGLLRAMGGDFDEGRRLIHKARATFYEFGLSRLTAVGTARDEALVERYAGEIAAGERLLRSACDELRSIGETGVLSTIVGELAEALYELGRYADADEASGESQRLAQPTDAATQVLWRGVRAKLLARQGDGDEAIRLARESIEWAGTRPEELGNAYADLAEIWRLGGDSDRAAEALERAIAMYAQKGIVPMAARMRSRLEELRSSA